MAMAVVRVLLCVLIVAMDVAAGILAIQAQSAQDKVSALQQIKLERKKGDEHGVNSIAKRTA